MGLTNHVYVITVERCGDRAETLRALRSLLKQLWRQGQFKAVAVEPVTEELVVLARERTNSV